MNWDTPIHQISFLALDLEAAGMLPSGQGITEIGAARFHIRSDGTVQPGPTFQTLVKPDRLIPPRIAELTGIDDELVSSAPPLAEVWNAFHRFLDDGSPTVVLAHNARSDLGILEAASEATGLPWTPPDTLCTALISRAQWPEAPRYGLQSLLDWRQSDRSEPVHHRALPDALHTRTLFSLLVQDAGPRTLGPFAEPGEVAPPDKANQVAPPPRLKDLAQAISDQQQVSLSYRGGSKGKGARPVTPLGFFLQEGIIYLHGWCHLDEMAKVFRADRIRSFQLAEI